MSGPLQPAQPGAATTSPFHLLHEEALRALLVRSMTPYEWIKFAAVNKQCLRVVTAILQKPAPALFHIRNDSLKLMEVDLRTPIICGRSSLSAHVYPLDVLPHVSARACRLFMQSTAPMQFLLEPTNPLNGVMYSEYGGPWKHTLTQSVTLGLSDCFSLDVQYPDLHHAIFQLGCLRPPNLVGLLASTQPIDDLEPVDDVPDCLFDLLDDDLLSCIFNHMLPRIRANANPCVLLGMLSFLKLRGVSKSWQTWLAPHQLDFDTRMTHAILDRAWAVWANDPIDRRGVESVFLADHVKGKGERMVKSAFPKLSMPQVTDLLSMPASNVFEDKKGGTKPKSVEFAWSTMADLIEFVEGYYDDEGEWQPGAGDEATVWGCGGGPDRAFAQCSMQPGAGGFIDPNNMRPLNGSEKPATWDMLGIRKTLEWESQILSNKIGYCKSINLSSSANGTGTYRAELYRGGQRVHTFMIGIYPHPGSQSWGDVEDRAQQHDKFLRDLAFRTPSQTHIIRINADDFD